MPDRSLDDPVPDVVEQSEEVVPSANDADELEATGLGMTFGGLITLAPWLEARFGLPATHTLAIAVIVFSVRVLGEREPHNRVEALAGTLFGLVYVAFMLQYLVRIVTPLPGVLPRFVPR